MNIDWVNINSLTPNPKNPNKHSDEQVRRLADIIKYQGWRHPIIVDKNNLIWAGHGRLLAAKKLKLEKVPVHVQEFQSEEQAYAFLVSDNAIASWADLDLASVNTEVPGLGPDFDIDLLGIKDFELEPADKYGDKDPDEIPEVLGVARAKVGDLFLLGKHRLLCGDSTEKAEVERLMNGERADMVFTDPPYGIDVRTDFTKSFSGLDKNRRGVFKKVEGDTVEFDPSHILEIFQDTEEMFMWGANEYCHSLPYGSWVVWDKTKVECSIDQVSDFELCWSKKRHGFKTARILWSGYSAKEKGEDRVHPTQKPVSLAVWFLEKWGKKAINIWDGYLGSGSTLIACEKTNRKCYGMEIDPHYCDVIIARWEKFTGQKAEKLDG